MAVTPGLGALPTLEALTKSTNLGQTETTNANSVGSQVTNNTQLGTQQTNQGNTSMNQYSDPQLALQNQVLQQGSNILQGNYGPNVQGMPDAIRQKAWLDFNANNAFQLAAQHGAGSPAIQSAMQQYALGLAAQDAQYQLQAQNQALGAYEAAGKYAFTPQGQNTTAFSGVTNSTQNQQVSNNQSQNNQTSNLNRNENVFQLESGMDLTQLWNSMLGGGSYTMPPAVPGGSGGTAPNSTPFPGS